MNCPSVDLKALVFGELAGEELRPVEDHLAHCEGCRLEADRLRMTGAAGRSAVLKGSRADATCVE